MMHDAEKENEKNNTKNKTENSKLSKKQKVLICVGGILLTFIIIVLITFLPKLLNPDAGTVTTISQSSLEKVIEINDLSTLDYTYNAITAVYDEKNDTKLKYHVAYEGVVTAGIDITKINIETDENTKKIIITLPDAVIQDVSVDMGTLDFIFEDSDYETETVSQEAYKASLNDLERKAYEEVDLLAMAKDNAIAAMNALITPWVEQIDAEYEVEVK